MYKELSAELRIFETVCKHSNKPDTAFLARRSADAIEKLQKTLERSKDFEAFWQEEAEEALRKYQVAIANKPQWIPVTERLPNPTFAREWYLVALESGCVTTLGFERETMQWHITGSPVAYWMPIPEPPKEGE